MLVLGKKVKRRGLFHNQKKRLSFSFSNNNNNNNTQETEREIKKNGDEL
jgi:hypothetical protein